MHERDYSIAFGANLIELKAYRDSFTNIRTRIPNLVRRLPTGRYIEGQVLAQRLVQLDGKSLVGEGTYSRDRRFLDILDNLESHFNTITSEAVGYHFEGDVNALSQYERLAIEIMRKQNPSLRVLASARIAIDGQGRVPYIELQWPRFFEDVTQSDVLPAGLALYFFTRVPLNSVVNL